MTLPSHIFGENTEFPTAILALADGTVFKGISIGANGHTVAELVFNTSMTGFQEILTDPSYSQQIVSFTYPHVGNTGVNKEDVESFKTHAAGMVIRNCPDRISNFRATQSLPAYLKENGVVAISEVDTRKITRLLREKGAQGACILVGDDVEKALELARGYQGMQGQDLASQVSRQQTENWTEGTWQLGKGYTRPNQSSYHVVAYDFGVKSNILRILADKGCRFTVVPATTPAEDVLALNPDGVFLANGPGDPSACGYAVEAVKTLLDKKIPLFGICLGQQILAQAIGAQTLKM